MDTDKHGLKDRDCASKSARRWKKFPRRCGRWNPLSCATGWNRSCGARTRFCFSRRCRTNWMSGRCWKNSLAAGKICALPFFDSATKTYSARRVQNLATDIVTGKFGVREPAASCAEIPLEQFDLVLVPGMAFDWNGNRLGRGQGFYDRLLAKTQRREMRRGLRFSIAWKKSRRNRTMRR